MFRVARCAAAGQRQFSNGLPFGLHGIAVRRSIPSAAAVQHAAARPSKFIFEADIICFAY